MSPEMKTTLKKSADKKTSDGGEKIKDISKLSKKELKERTRKFSKQFCVIDGDNFQLKKFLTDPDVDLGPEDKPLMNQTLQVGVEMLATMQDILYAQDKWSLLLIFQAMDAAGKDGAIKHVMSGVNPQGCQVTSFKAPSPEELDHDFLWRCQRELPERGRIGIFNRSYYEEVLIARVHEPILKAEKLPAKLVTKDIWNERYKDIRNFEK
jgi:polyphosphate kinase 2 (PPK2 family)